MNKDLHLARGKRKDSGKWVYGAYVEDFLALKVGDKERSNQPSIFVVSNANDGEDVSGWVEVDQATVGRCTGLKDKNNKLIFEGDIVKRIAEIAPVYWNGGSWVLDFSRSDKWLKKIQYECKIIGNIHDNLELLDGGQQFRHRLKKEN